MKMVLHVSIDSLGETDLCRAITLTNLFRSDVSDVLQGPV